MNLNLDTTEFQQVSDINVPDIFYRRLKTGMSDLDEIFGDGILPGSSVTLTARAGCGKTTFLLQLCEALSKNNYKVGYASGEENTFQLAFNCRRLNIHNVQVANITDVDKLCKATEQFDVLVVDSFQALSSGDEMNSRELERYAVTSLVTAAKNNECTVFFVMHLTKAGVLKGGTLIPHTVDVNMEITLDEDAGDDNARVIKFTKNRFGTCGDYSAYMGPTGFTFNGKVDAVFEKLKNWFKNVITDAINYFGDINQLTPEVREIYSKMLIDGDIEIQQPRVVSKVQDDVSGMYEVEKPKVVSKASMGPSVKPRPDQLNVMDSAGDEYLDHLVDDGEGNYVFFHVTTLDLSNDYIDPEFFGRNPKTGKDEQPGVKISMYYPGSQKADVAGEFLHAIKVPKNMVYPFNKDPLNFYDEAYKRFREKYQYTAFDANKQVGFISQVAAENGYPMTVAKWNGVYPLRVQTAVKIKPELVRDAANVYLPEVLGLKQGVKATPSKIVGKGSMPGVGPFERGLFVTNTAPVIKSLKEVELASSDGATLNLDGSNYENGGLVVPVKSKNTDQEKLSSEMMFDFMDSNKNIISSDIFKMGLYKFEGETTVSIDLNIVIPREYREIALKFGRLAGQESLFDLDTFENIKTGASGKNPREFTPEEYAQIALSLSKGELPEFMKKPNKSATSRLKSKMSAIGPKGVEALNNAVEEGVAIRFLSAAKEMERRFGLDETDWLRKYPEGSAIKKMLNKIKLVTGFERGTDGMWRFEISDSNARVIGEKALRTNFRDFIEGISLSEVIQHDELFKAYPELKDVTVYMFSGYNFDFEASYQRESNSLHVMTSLGIY